MIDSNDSVDSDIDSDSDSDSDSVSPWFHLWFGYIMAQNDQATDDIN